MHLSDITAHAANGGRFSVEGGRGIAFYLDRAETTRDEDYEWTGIETATGMLVMVMVGDDREHIIDPDDVHPLNDGEYCKTCGQIGCMHNA